MIAETHPAIILPSNIHNHYRDTKPDYITLYIICSTWTTGTCTACTNVNGVRLWAVHMTHTAMKNTNCLAHQSCELKTTI